MAKSGQLIGVCAGLVVVVGFAAWVNSLEKRIDGLEQDLKVLRVRAANEPTASRPEAVGAPIQKPATDDKKDAAQAGGKPVNVSDRNNKHTTADIGLSRKAAHSSPCDKILADLNNALDRNDSNEANRQDELAFKFNCGLTPEHGR